MELSLALKRSSAKKCREIQAPNTVFLPFLVREICTHFPNRYSPLFPVLSSNVLVYLAEKVLVDSIYLAASNLR